MTIPNRNFNYPTSLKFGAGRIAELADYCRAAGIERPLFVTDPGLASMPMVQKIVADVKRHNRIAVGCDDISARNCKQIMRSTDQVGRFHQRQCRPFRLPKWCAQALQLAADSAVQDRDRHAASRSTMKLTVVVVDPPMLSVCIRLAPST